MLLEQLKERLEAEQKKARSAWEKGVFSYAVEMVENVQNDSIMSREQYAEKHDVGDFLNHVGGRGINMNAFWTVDDRIKVRHLSNDASWGGNFEMYNDDVVKRLCTPGEIKKYESGRMQYGPNSKEQWIDVQSRAVNQAVNKIHFILRHP